MNKNTARLEKLEEKRKQVDRNSVILLLLLTVPLGIMAVVLFLWPDTFWLAEVPYIAIELLGSFAIILLAVFIIVQYLSRQWVILYVGAGLVAIGIVNGFQAITQPGSPEFIWLHSFSGIFGGGFFALYALTKIAPYSTPSTKITVKRVGWLFGGILTFTSLFGVLSIAFSETLPVMMREGHFTPIALIINAVPIALFIFAGTNLFWQYRRSGSHELFLITAILIFLFQASEVFYFAALWSVIWWLGQTLRLAIFLVVLGYVLKKYLQTSVSLTTEIGERKRVEQALRKAEQDWRNSFNSLEEVMLIIDKDYKIENINSSGLVLFGKNKGEVIGKKCYQALYSENKPCEHCVFKQILKTKKVESVNRYDDSFHKHFSIKSSPMFDENGEVVKFVLLMRDITKRVKAAEKEKKLQQELNITNRLVSIGEMAAGIAHEINNPLTGVIGFAQLLKEMDVPENIKGAVKVIDDGARRVAGVVEKLLTFARRISLDKEYVDINSVILGVVEMRSYELHTNNIEVTTQLSSDPLWTMVNVGQLQQVFLNIIVNAEQAMAEAKGKGRLLIKTENIDNRVRVSIADNGPGIARDNISKLFDPFFTTKGVDEGTGLGLSISYGIIKEHAGKIHVESILGGGATFIVELPIIAETRQPEMAETLGNEPEPEKVTGARIIVVDDEPNICQILERILTREGYKVETAFSAQAALQRLNVAKYDLILLDIKMPGMNGIEFYKHIKEIDPSLQRKVVCITGDVISPKSKAFLNQTGITCITKPFSINKLTRQVKSAIRKVNGAEIY